MEVVKNFIIAISLISMIKFEYLRQNLGGDRYFFVKSETFATACLGSIHYPVVNIRNVNNRGVYPDERIQTYHQDTKASTLPFVYIINYRTTHYILES